MNTLEALLNQTINRDLSECTISKPVQKDGLIKIRLRPVMHRQTLLFQAEEYTKTQVFHKNMSRQEAIAYVQQQIPSAFLQAQLQSGSVRGTVLASKKGTVTVKTKHCTASDAPKITLEHNRQKQYILKEGIPVPFLVDLGVMTADGKIIRPQYDKFRQINRFLELIEDILPELPRNREIRILDFGCGKS